MIHRITEEKILDKKWNDNFVVLFFENDLCKEYDKAITANLHASKKEFLRKVSLLGNISSEIIFIIENISGINQIEAIQQSQKLTITTETSVITTTFSKQLSRILQELK